MNADTYAGAACLSTGRHPSTVGELSRLWAFRAAGGVWSGRLGWAGGGEGPAFMLDRGIINLSFELELYGVSTFSTFSSLESRTLETPPSRPVGGGSRRRLACGLCLFCVSLSCPCGWELGSDTSCTSRICVTCYELSLWRLNLAAQYKSHSLACISQVLQIGPPCRHGLLE